MQFCPACNPKDTVTQNCIKRTINTVTLHLDVIVIVPTPIEKKKKGYHIQVNGDWEGGWGASEPRSFRGRGTGNIRDGIVGGQRVYGGRNLRDSEQRKEWRTKTEKKSHSVKV